jgi:DNA-binding transcriptional MerR regulator
VGNGPIPEKMFYKIGEVARITGLEPYVLRYWETEFPEINPRKGRGGQREYRRQDLDVILTIQRMLHGDQYTISGAKRKLREAGADACAQLTQEAASKAAPGGAENRADDELVQKTQKGLRELLQLMDNTDSLRTG